MMRLGIGFSLVIWCGVTLFFHLLAVELPPLEVKAEVDRLTATSGEFLIFQIAVTHSARLTLRPVEFPKEFQKHFDLEALEISPLPEAEGALRHTQWRWRLWPKHPGKATIPALPIATIQTLPQSKEPRQQAQTNEIDLEITSLIPEGQDLTFKELKATVPLPINWKRWGMLAGMIGFALLALGGLLYWYRRRPRYVPVVPPEKPHERAFRRLRDLQNFISANPQAIQPYYYNLSEIFREYLEGCFGFPASSMTTQELLPILEHQTPYSAEERLRIQALTEKSDWVKYAASQPSRAEMEEAYQEISRLIEKIAFATPVTPSSPASAETSARIQEAQ